MPAERPGPLAPTAAAHVERSGAVLLHAAVLRAVILDRRLVDLEILGIGQPIVETRRGMHHERLRVLERDLVGFLRAVTAIGHDVMECKAPAVPVRGPVR